MSPELFLLVFLPILLYGSGSSLDWHTFFRNSAQIFSLAFPGVAIHTCLVAIVYRYVFPYNWNWKEAFLFGSIISATDPVAVVCSLPRSTHHHHCRREYHTHTTLPSVLWFVPTGSDRGCS